VAVLLGSVALALTAGWGAQHLGFSNDYRVFFSKDNPQLTAFEAVQNIYTKNDNILFVVAPADQDAFSPDSLAAVEALVEGAWQLPYALRVDGLTNFQHTRADGDDLVVTDLVEDALGQTPAELAAARTVALSEPLLVRQLIADDARVAGVNVTLQFPEESPTETSEAVGAARDLARAVEADHPGLAIGLTGMAMLSNSFSEEAERDMATLVPVMYGVILFALVILLRSVSGTVATFSVIVFAVVTAMGVAGWFGLLLTPPSSIAPTMIMTLAVADSVHILVTMLVGMRAGRSKHDALVESLRVNLQPVFLTSLTTAIGFLSMNFSDAPPFRDLGNITAFGVVAAWFFSITSLPALLAILPMRTRSSKAVDRGLMGGLGRLVVAQHRPLLWGVSALVIALAALVPLNVLNDDFVDYFDQRVPFRQDTDFANQNLTGIYALEFSIGSGESGGISEPAYLEHLDEFTRWYREQPDVAQVVSLSDMMRRLNRNMHGDDVAFHRIPESRELAAQYLLLYEMSLPFGLDLNNQINVDKSATRVVVTVHDVPSRRFRDLAAAGEAWLRDNTPDAMHATAASSGLMFAYISERNIKGMLTGTLIAFLLVSAVLAVALRSVRFGVISLIPNIVPAIMAFGVWGLFVGQVNIAISMVVAMTVGIVVDDTIHFLSKYLRARREARLDAPEAVRYAFQTVGTALVFTSTVLAAGFAVLSFSAFDLNAGMGRLTAITILLALVADFFLLAPLLVRLDGRQAAVDTSSEVSDQSGFYPAITEEQLGS
jgi:predicted RND superfamily exporter protein